MKKVQKIPLQSKFFPWIAMLFMTLAICDVLLVYRLVNFAGLTLTAGVFVMPIYYMLQDVVAEIYGLRIARQMIIIMIICMYVLSAIITLGIHLPFPSDWQHHDEQFKFVLGHLFRTNILGFLSVLAGAFANVYFITRWKVLLHGRYFWGRSLGASAIGETLSTIIGSYVLYFHIYPNKEIFNLIWPVCFLLIIQNTFYSFIGAIMVSILKKIEISQPLEIIVHPTVTNL